VSEREPIHILLVDDQRLMREGLRTLLELHGDLHVVGEAGDGTEAEDFLRVKLKNDAAELQPLVVLMDLRMPRTDGVTATARIKKRWADIQILVLTTFDDDELVFQSIEAGASGYLLKDVGSDALADAVRAASRGDAPLQPSVVVRFSAVCDLQRLQYHHPVGSRPRVAGVQLELELELEKA
jgi:DNA-binding NarL/FixJ family response regulator